MICPKFLKAHIGGEGIGQEVENILDREVGHGLRMGTEK